MAKATYTDIDPNFTKNPKTKDVVVVLDADSIRVSVRNLLSTAFGERLFQPRIGGSLRPLLFEPMDGVTTMEMRDRILMTLANHEPRVKNVIVDVIGDDGKNAYTVNIEYAIRGIGRADRVSVVLERIR